MPLLCRIGIHHWQVKFEHRQRAYDGVWFDTHSQRCTRPGCRYGEWASYTELARHQMPVEDDTLLL